MFHEKNKDRYLLDLKDTNTDSVLNILIYIKSCVVSKIKSSIKINTKAKCTFWLNKIKCVHL